MEYISLSIKKWGLQNLIINTFSFNNYVNDYALVNGLEISCFPEFNTLFSQTYAYQHFRHCFLLSRGVFINTVHAVFMYNY